MNCRKCGMNLNEGDVFCPNCGTKVQNNEVQYNYNNMNNQPQKSDNSVKIIIGVIIGIVVLLIMIFAIFFAFTMLGSFKNINNKNYKVNFEGFKLYLPEYVEYSIDNSAGNLQIGDQNQTWMADIMIKQAPYSSVMQRKDTIASNLKQSFAQYNPKVSKPKVETLYGVEFILLEVEAGGEKFIMGFAELNSTYIIGFQIMNEDYDFNRDYIENIAYIIKNAEYTGRSSNIEINSNVEGTNSFIEALKKEVEEN